MGEDDEQPNMERKSGINFILLIVFFIYYLHFFHTGEIGIAILQASSI